MLFVIAHNNLFSVSIRRSVEDWFKHPMQGKVCAAHTQT